MQYCNPIARINIGNITSCQTMDMLKLYIFNFGVNLFGGDLMVRFRCLNTWFCHHKHSPDVSLKCVSEANSSLSLGSRVAVDIHVT